LFGTADVCQIVLRHVAVKNYASNDWTMLRGICFIKEVYIRKSL